MELLLDIIADWVLDLLGKAVRNSKSSRTQRRIDVLVASVFLLAVDGYAVWNAVRHYRQGSIPMAVVFAAVVLISILLMGFVILRRSIRKKKAEESTP